MAPPSCGAMGATFTAMRGCQIVCLVSIIGLTSSFVSELVSQRIAVPSAFVGTLVVACFITLYVGISFILYWDHMLPLLIATTADALCFVSSTIVACIIGGPVNHLTCGTYPRKGIASNFLYSVFSNVDDANAERHATSDRASCVELKALWGLSIATAITFSVSAAAAISLWKRIKGGNNDIYKEKDNDSSSQNYNHQGNSNPFVSSGPAPDPYQYRIPDPE